MRTTTQWLTCTARTMQVLSFDHERLYSRYLYVNTLKNCPFQLAKLLGNRAFFVSPLFSFAFLLAFDWRLIGARPLYYTHES